LGVSAEIDMKVRFWGTRGSIAAPGKDTAIYGGNTTCVEVILGSGRKVIIDAGTGIRLLGRHLEQEMERVDIHLLVTHIHWDHVLGFPFFGPVYTESSTLLIDGYPSCMKGLRYAFDNHMGDGFFPVRFSELKAQIQYLDTLNHGPLEIEEALIETIPLQHPQGGFGYRFREGTKTLVFITDNELCDEPWVSRHPDEYVRFCQDADLLIHDSQYDPDEIESRRGWGHSEYVSTCNMAVRAGVKRLILFHHDPWRKDSEIASIKGRCDELVAAKGAQIEIDAAKEGTEIQL
jgi:phosphoribosyl 1,2-cyclic phosphodiesterase